MGSIQEACELKIILSNLWIIFLMHWDCQTKLLVMWIKRDIIEQMGVAH